MIYHVSKAGNLILLMQSNFKTEHLFDNGTLKKETHSFESFEEYMKSNNENGFQYICSINIEGKLSVKKIREALPELLL